MTGARPALASAALFAAIVSAGCYGSYGGTTADGTSAADGGATSADDAQAASGSTAGDGNAQTTNTSYDTPPTCTSGTTYGGGEGSSGMDPGQACINCHGQGEGPTFFVAGTVYPTAHEPNQCNGKSGISVVITDANGSVFTLPTNSAGNFACGSRARSGFPSCAGFTTPYSAKVVSNGVERSMGAQQTTGDCNGCHTETGANNAPGRIMAP